MRQISGDERRKGPAATAPNHPSFSFDAMLMYGWVADQDLNVRSINVSLRNWMRTHRVEIPDFQATNISIRKFFERICGGDDYDVGSLLERNLRDVTQLVEGTASGESEKKLYPDGPFSILRGAAATSEGANAGSHTHSEAGGHQPEGRLAG